MGRINAQRNRQIIGTIIMTHNQIKERAELHAKTMCKTWFDDMHDPRMRGSKFTWRRFREILKGHVKVMMFIYFEDRDEFHKNKEFIDSVSDKTVDEFCNDYNTDNLTFE